MSKKVQATEVAIDKKVESYIGKIQDLIDEEKTNGKDAGVICFVDINNRVISGVTGGGLNLINLLLNSLDNHESLEELFTEALKIRKMEQLEKILEENIDDEEQLKQYYPLRRFRGDSYILFI